MREIPASASSLFPPPLLLMQISKPFVSLIGLNLGLLGALGYLLTERTAGSPQTTPPGTAMATVSTAPLPFHWSQIESDDYSHFIANLRGIGCPEQTLRSIIEAEI